MAPSYRRRSALRVVIKRPPLVIEGKEIPPELLKFLRSNYTSVKLITDSGDEAAESLPLYAAMTAATPGMNIRFYRERDGLTQEQLGRRIGRFSRQAVSDMEHGRRPISKAVAKRLAELFAVSVERFI